MQMHMQMHMQMDPIGESMQTRCIGTDANRMHLQIFRDLSTTVGVLGDLYGFSGTPVSKITDAGASARFRSTEKTKTGAGIR